MRLGLTLALGAAGLLAAPVAAPAQAWPDRHDPRRAQASDWHRPAADWRDDGWYPRGRAAWPDQGGWVRDRWGRWVPAPDIYGPDGYYRDRWGRVVRAPGRWGQPGPWGYDDYRCRRDSNLDGAVTGAVLGGLIGSKAARRGEKTEGAIAGAVLGGVVGGALDSAEGRRRCY